MEKNIGKVVNYNDGIGFIIDEKGNKYSLINSSFQYKDVKNGDIVSFKKEKYKTVEIEEDIATFVKKIDSIENIYSKSNQSNDFKS